MARVIPITKGQVTVVDDEDFERVNRFRWTASALPEGGYRVVRFIKGKPLYLHRFITNCPADLEVDHRDRDALNNQRSNLRIATRAQNAQNRRMQSNNTTGVKGVIFNKQYQKYEATIYAYGKKYFLGRFVDLAKAAEAYREAANRLHGEFASI